jgi:hypothetical protein
MIFSALELVSILITAGYSIACPVDRCMEDTHLWQTKKSFEGITERRIIANICLTVPFLVVIFAPTKRYGIVKFSFDRLWGPQDRSVPSGTQLMHPPFTWAEIGALFDLLFISIASILCYVASVCTDLEEAHSSIWTTQICNSIYAIPIYKQIVARAAAVQCSLK